MKDLRDNEVKAYFDSSEFKELKAACSAAKVKHSRLLRDLALDWMRQRQSTGTQAQDDRPNSGRNWALPVANSRWNFGGAPVRPRI
jgi:hypothetical protein